MAGTILDDVDYQDVTGSGMPDEPMDDDNQAQDGERKERLVPLSKRTKQAQFKVLKSQCMADMDASEPWRSQATRDFGFVAGEQLSSEDKELLNAQQRPHVVFNRTLLILKAIRGMEINGRNDIAYIPRNNSDTESNEILSAGSDWMAQGCNAVDEESEAFQDCAVTGMGWVECRYSYLEEPEGKYIEEQIDNREMVWDRRACKKNLVDAKRMFRIRRMPLCDAYQMFPGKTKVQLNADWADGIGRTSEPKSIEEKRIRDGKDSYDDEFDDANEVTVVCAQWRETESYWMVADDRTGERMEVNEKQYEQLKLRMELMGMEMTSVQMDRYVYRQAFLGSEYLKGGDAPAGRQFSWACMTGEYDKDRRMFYGVTRTVRDPQMWANKFMSQVMYIMNSTAKGGILAETTAFEDQRDAEDGYASQDRITWVTEGSISGQRPRIMPKPGAGDASSFVELLQYSVGAIKDVTGVNPELLGQQDMQNPGVVEHMRKQAGMTTLATLFDSKKRFLEQIGKVRLYFLQTRVPEGTLIRVVGDQYDVRAVALSRQNTTGTYDVIVDDAPTSPNQKEANWAIIQPLLGVFKDQLMGNPQVLVMIMQYSPLPAPLVNAISKVILQAQNDPQAAQQAQEMKQLAVQKLTAEIDKDQSIAEMNNAKAGATQATAAYDVAIAQHLMTNTQNEATTNYIKAQEAAAKLKEAGSNSALTHAKAVREQVGAHLDIVDAHNSTAETHANVLKARTDALATAHGAHSDRMAAEGGAHADLATAFRNRVQAHVAAKMANQPQQQVSSE